MTRMMADHLLHDGLDQLGRRACVPEGEQVPLACEGVHSDGVHGRQVGVEEGEPVVGVGGEDHRLAELVRDHLE